MFELFRFHYAQLRERRDAVAAEHEKIYDHLLYRPGRRAARALYPKGLPKADKLPDLAVVYGPKSDKPPPSQKTLTSVVHHGSWLECLTAARAFDVAYLSVSCKNRDATRFISKSQMGAGAWLDIVCKEVDIVEHVVPTFAVSRQHQDMFQQLQ